MAQDQLETTNGVRMVVHRDYVARWRFGWPCGYSEIRTGQRGPIGFRRLSLVMRHVSHRHLMASGSHATCRVPLRYCIGAEGARELRR